MNQVVKRPQSLERRGDILALQDLMCSLPEEDQFDIESLTEHFFAPGCYARKYFIEAGSIVIGKIHKTEHFNIVCQGKCSVSTEDGPLIIEGPEIFVSRPGVKKAVFAIKDTTWITIHVTDKTDVDEIEDEVIAKTFDEVDALLEGGSIDKIAEDKS